MARTTTFLKIYTDLSEMADSEGDGHIAAEEKRKAINRAVTETWDTICSYGLGEKYVKSATFTSTAGTIEHLFSAICTDGDFYRVHQLYSVEGSQLRPLQKIQPSEIRPFKACPTACSMKLYYIPCAPAPDPAVQATWEAQTFDGVNGWEEHVLVTAIGHIKRKKDDSYSPWAQRKREIEQRMALMGNVDVGEPARVSRKRKRTDPWFVFNQNVNAYGIRGDKLELYFYDGIVI